MEESEGQQLESALGSSTWRTEGAGLLCQGAGQGVPHGRCGERRSRLREWSDLSSVGRLPPLALARADRQVGAGPESLTLWTLP